MGRRQKAKKDTYKVFILSCNGEITRDDNWRFSPYTTYEFYEREDNFGLGFEVTLAVDENGRNLNLQINEFASFIKDGMLLGECIVKPRYEHNCDAIYEVLQRGLAEMNSNPKIDWIARDEENYRQRIAYAEAYNLIHTNSNIIIMK